MQEDNLIEIDRSEDDDYQDALAILAMSKRQSKIKTVSVMVLMAIAFFMIFVSVPALFRLF